MTPAERKQQLIARATAGDMAAFEQLFMAERRRLLAFIRQLLPANLSSLIDPADVLQDTMYDAFRSHASFESKGEDAVYQWLAAIAKNHVLNLVRSQQALKRGGGWTRLDTSKLTDDASVVSVLDEVAQYRRTPSASAAKHELVLLVEQALGLLSEDHRRALTLRYIEGKDVAAVAAELGRSEGSVKMLCVRGLANLRETLRDAADGV